MGVSLLRKRNIRKMLKKIELFAEGKISFVKFLAVYQGWQAYAKWADIYNLRKRLEKKVNSIEIKPKVL